VAIARERVPDADVRVGDMEELPFDDDTFDVVTGFSAFFFADDMVAALREAGRVARPGAPVLIQVWGDRENCDVIPMLKAAGSLRPPTGPPKPPAAPLSTPGLLEERTMAAGMEPETTFDVRYTVEYPDEATLLRRMLAVGGVVAAIEVAGEEAVSAAILEALAPRRRHDGSYRLENEWRCLIARAC
jgi:SAM-dependent methyltransferase